MYKRLIAIMMVMVLLLPATGICEASIEKEGYPMNIIDALGREIVIYERPERLVSLSPSVTEILFALEVGDRIVGIDDGSEYPETAIAPPNRLGDIDSINIKSVLASQPDIVFAESGLQADVIKSMEALNLTVAAVDIKTYSDISPLVSEIALYTGADAQRVLDEMTVSETEALATVAGSSADNMVSAYVALDYGAAGNRTFGAGTFVSDMLAMLNIANAGDALGVGDMTLTSEQLTTLNPGVILVPGDESDLAAFLAYPAYAALNAVKAGRVYMLPTSACDYPAPHTAAALASIASTIAPFQIKKIG